jgi:ABC-type dipeptide/oligopeptide/nickel transport system ATPase subunit
VEQDGILPYVAADFHCTAQIIFQNPYSSLIPHETVRDIVSVPLRKRGITDPVERDEEKCPVENRRIRNPVHC